MHLKTIYNIQDGDTSHTDVYFAISISIWTISSPITIAISLNVIDALASLYFTNHSVQL